MVKSKYDVRQREFIYDSYVRTESARTVRRLFQQEFPDVQVPDRSKIHRLVNKVRDTGSVLDRKRKHPRTVLTEETLDTVGRALERSPGNSVRRLSREMGISYGSVQAATKLLKNLSRLRKRLRKGDDNDEGGNMDAVVQQILMNPPEVIIKEEPVVQEEAECDVGAGAQQDFEFVSVKEEPIDHPDESTSPAPEESCERMAQNQQLAVIIKEEVDCDDYIGPLPTS